MAHWLCLSLQLPHNLISLWNPHYSATICFAYLPWYHIEIQLYHPIYNPSVWYTLYIYAKNGSNNHQKIKKSYGHYLQTLPILFSGSSPTKKYLTGSPFESTATDVTKPRQIQAFWVGTWRRNRLVVEKCPTDVNRKLAFGSPPGQPLSSLNNITEWHWNRQLSRKLSPCSSWSRKMLQMSCGGKVWRTGKWQE